MTDDSVKKLESCKNSITLYAHIDDVVNRLNDALNGNISEFKTPDKVYKNLLISMPSNLNAKYIIPEQYTQDIVNKIKKSWEYESACGVDYITFDYYCNMIQKFGQAVAQYPNEFPHNTEMFKFRSQNVQASSKYEGTFCTHGVGNNFPELSFSGVKNTTESNEQKKDVQENNDNDKTKSSIIYTFKELNVVSEVHWSKYFTKIGNVFGGLFKFTLLVSPLFIIFLLYKDFSVDTKYLNHDLLKLINYYGWFAIIYLIAYGVLSAPIVYWLKARYQERLLKKQIEVYPFNAGDFSVEDAPLFLTRYDKFEFFKLVNDFYYNYIYNRFLPNFGRIIALDADYGMGKTSFLNLLESKIKYDTMFFALKHLKVKANIFRNLAFERNIDYVKISITEIPEILSADATTSRKKINQLIYRNLDKSFKYYARNMLKSSEVSSSSVKFVFDRFTSIFMSKTKDDIILSNTRLLLVIEDIDRLDGDDLNNTLNNLLFLQNIPMVTTILPLDMKRVDDCFLPKEDLADKLRIERQLKIKIFTNKYPYSGNVRTQLASYYVDNIMPKQTVDNDLLKKYNINDTEVKRIRTQLNLYYQNILASLFNHTEITIREFKNCLAEKPNTNYYPDHFVNSLVKFRADNSISMYLLKSWIGNEDTHAKNNYMEIVNNFIPVLYNILGVNNIYTKGDIDFLYTILSFIFSVDVYVDDYLFVMPQLNSIEKFIMIKYDIDLLLKNSMQFNLQDTFLKIQHAQSVFSQK